MAAMTRLSALRPALLSAAALLAARVGAAQSDLPMRGIDHHNRVLLVRAHVLGRSDGVVLVLTRPAAVPQVTDRLRAIGAEVLAHFDEVGYLRVRLPLAQFARARTLPDVIEARIDAGQLSYDYDQG